MGPGKRTDLGSGHTQGQRRGLFLHPKWGEPHQDHTLAISEESCQYTCPGAAPGCPLGPVPLPETRGVSSPSSGRPSVLWVGWEG